MDFDWNVDNYGPIIIPKKGWTVKLDSLTLPVYGRAIEVYEGNKLKLKMARFSSTIKKQPAIPLK
jgi:signal peptidase I